MANESFALVDGLNLNRWQAIVETNIEMQVVKKLMYDQEKLCMYWKRDVIIQTKFPLLAAPRGN